MNKIKTPESFKNSKTFKSIKAFKPFNKINEEEFFEREFLSQGQSSESSNVIKTENNTMYIEDKPQTFELISEPGSESGSEPVYIKNNACKLYKLFLGEFDEQGTGNHAILNRLQLGNPLEDIVELHISSNGGNYFELVQLYNILNSMYPESITTFLNFGYSAGALAFLFGTNRIVYENSDFMIHSYSTGVFGKRDDMLKRMFHSDRHITTFFNKMLSPYFSKDELESIHSGNDYWLSANEMIERNIATGIILEGTFYTREEYLKILHPEEPKKSKKSKTSKETKETKDTKDTKDTKETKKISTKKEQK